MVSVVGFIAVGPPLPKPSFAVSDGNTESGIPVTNNEAGTDGSVVDIVVVKFETVKSLVKTADGMVGCETGAVIVGIVDVSDCVIEGWSACVVCNADDDAVVVPSS